MTCIVAITQKNKVWIGADSAGVAGHNLNLHGDTKVFVKKDDAGNPWLFGFTTSFRMGQIIQHILKIPRYNKEKDIHNFLVTKFVPVLSKILAKEKWEKTEKGEAEGGEFIVGLAGKIFVIFSDYQVMMPMEEFASVGSGKNLAMGALYATKNIQDPEKRLLIALEAAESFNSSVRRPFKIVHT
jgi:ATP-dependent protease HslVU (ClpYQ) peptidase subunit